MIVGYHSFKPHVASMRLRAIIPAREMRNMGVKIGYGGTFVAMKHGFEWHKLPRYTRLVYDVCDDHFHDQLQAHYRKGCLIADSITCNSDEMRKIIKTETGRDAVVIPEPYESDEREPSIGPAYLWFGHNSNLIDVESFNPAYPLTIVSNDERYKKWSKETMANEMAKPNIVIIPTGKSMAKSENRMVESIRNGKYVCAEYLPAYRPFTEFFPCGCINHNAERALNDPDAAKQAIRAAQDYIRDKYSPETIAKKWMEVLQ